MIGRDKLVVSFGWCIPSEQFAWSSVQFSRYEVKVLLGVLVEVGSFGEELADQSVPVFVGASLSW